MRLRGFSRLSLCLFDTLLQSIVEEEGCVNHLQRIPKVMRPQLKPMRHFAARRLRPTTIHTDLREGERGRGGTASGTGHAHTLSADALRFVICVFDEPKLVADPLSTKLTHFMANGIHKQQQKPKQSAHTTTIERERESESASVEESRVGERARALQIGADVGVAVAVAVDVGAASLRKIISICCCCFCYSSCCSLPLFTFVSAVCIGVCVCVCVCCL